jgi:hypothetical protein
MMNNIKINNIKPEVGMGVTQCHPNDRYPWTILAVLSEFRLLIQADKHDMSKNQYGQVLEISRRASGAWREVGRDHTSPRFDVGVREFYQSPEI